ncbi:phosphatidylinositol-binding protein scs2 [Blastocladiella emersonii ATCC 22665]|nr:phosphatidylinositol-binding protein scs2 [Blastocladiella emersonii ATCC 22665]
MLEITPHSDILFAHAGDSVALHLSNPSPDRTIAFKVKTTAPKHYVVRPNAGVVRPNSRVVVSVTACLQASAGSDAADRAMRGKDKFLVEGAILRPHELGADVVSLWPAISPERIHEHRLRAVFPAGTHVPNGHPQHNHQQNHGDPLPYFAHPSPPSSAPPGSYRPQHDDMTLPCEWRSLTRPSGHPPPPPPPPPIPPRRGISPLPTSSSRVGGLVRATSDVSHDRRAASPSAIPVPVSPHRRAASPRRPPDSTASGGSGAFRHLDASVTASMDLPARIARIEAQHAALWDEVQALRRVVGAVDLDAVGEDGYHERRRLGAAGLGAAKVGPGTAAAGSSASLWIAMVVAIASFAVGLLVRG